MGEVFKVLMVMFMIVTPPVVLGYIAKATYVYAVKQDSLGFALSMYLIMLLAFLATLRWGQLNL